MLANLSILTAVLCGIVVAGYILSKKDKHNPAYLALSSAIAAIVAFFGVLLLPIGFEHADVISEGSLRTAITVALLIEYILLIASHAFTGGLPANQQANPIAMKLVTSFTWVIGVVILFYFGTSAYVEVNLHKSSDALEMQTIVDEG